MDKSKPKKEKKKEKQKERVKNKEKEMEKEKETAVEKDRDREEDEGDTENEGEEVDWNSEDWKTQMSTKRSVLITIDNLTKEAFIRYTLSAFWLPSLIGL